MKAIPFQIAPQLPADHDAVGHLLDLGFGLGRRAKTSYRLREGERPVDGLSFVARGDGPELAGAISYWRVFIGESRQPALLLGPLAVHPSLQGQGIGRALMRLTLYLAQARGETLVILVGDEPFYARVGFAKLPEGRLIMPGYVDPDRFLYLELVKGSLASARGLVLPPSRAMLQEGAGSTAFAIPHQADQREKQGQCQEGAEH